MPAVKKAKSAAPDLSLADIAALNRNIEANLIEDKRLADELAARKQALDEEYAALSETQLLAARRAADTIREWATKHRTEILPKDKATVDLPDSGSMQWFTPKASLEIGNVGETIKRLEEREDKLTYLKYEPSINKEALKNAPQVWQTLPGVRLKQSEKFVLRFNNTQLRLERPAKGGGTWKVVQPEEKK